MAIFKTFFDVPDGQECRPVGVWPTPNSDKWPFKDKSRWRERTTSFEVSLGPWETCEPRVALTREQIVKVILKERTTFDLALDIFNAGEPL